MPGPYRSLHTMLAPCHDHQPHCWRISAYRLDYSGEVIGDPDHYLHLIAPEVRTLMDSVTAHFLDLAAQGREGLSAGRSSSG
jgi:hypothetical protein